MVNTHRCRFCLHFSLSHFLYHTYTHTLTLQLPTVFWGGTGRFPARENLCFRMIRGEADGTISEAAAACPVALSGAENQDNFIVIISLPLSLSLQVMEEKQWKHKEEEECDRKRGREKERGKRKE